MKNRRDCNCPCHSGSVVGYMKKRPQLDLGRNFEFPLYVCLDEGTVIPIETPDRILYHLEAVDIENDEYLFWDAQARPLKIGITNGKVASLESTENEITLVQAFEKYAEQLGVNIDVSGKPEDVWATLRKAEENRPRSPDFFSRLFGARKT
jgi:hypothetical protein